jgi:hypothetical protein
MVLIMELPNYDTLFTNYQTEILGDIKVDEFSLKDKAMLVPVIKHKWVARLMMHKDQMRRLANAKKSAIKAHTANTPVALSRQAAEQAALNDPNIAKLDESVEKLKIIIEYLEKVEKLTGSLTFDCKNVIDLQKLETT